MLQITIDEKNSMTHDELEFIECIQYFIKTEKKIIITECINSFSEFCFNNEPYDEKESRFNNTFVDKLINLLNIPELLRMNKSYHFIVFFLNDWQRFTITQKETLLKTFQDIIPMMKDTTALMIFIEIISEYMADTNSLKILNNLKNVPNNENFKYLIPYGYKLLIINTNNELIKTNAYKELLLMKDDSIENVKTEAKYALHILEKI
jgi:hypothetical protein